MSDDRKDLPPANSPKFNERVREALSTYLGNRGDRLDRGLTLRDLVESNIIKLRAGFLATGSGNPIAGPGGALGGNAAYEPDLTPPPVPTGFLVTAAFSNIIIEHDAPLYPQGHGHAKTVLYGVTWTSGPLPTFSDAVKLTEFTGTVFAHPTNPATTWHLWIKWVTNDGVASPAPAGGTNGLVATTAQDPSTLLAALTSQLTETEFDNRLRSRIDLIDGPDDLPGSVSAKIKVETTARTTQDAAFASQITTVAARAGFSRGNLIRNGGTEMGLTGWTLPSGVQGDGSVWGRYASAMSPTGAGIPQFFGIYAPSTGVTEGWTYTMSLDSLATGSNGATNVSVIVWYDAVGGHISTSSSGIVRGDHSFSTEPGTREAYAVTAVAPTGAVAALCGIWISNFLPTGLWAEFAVRQVKLEAGEGPPTPYSTEATTRELFAAVQIETEARVTLAGNLYAQHAIKIDLAGLVSGYGLASSASNAAPTSAFGVRAGSFFVAPPAMAQATAPTDNLYDGFVWLDTSVVPNVTRYRSGADWVLSSPVLPFVIQTVPTVENGVAVPPGVYANDLFVRNGTITNAKIANLAVDDAKIASLSVAKLIAGSIAVGQYIQGTGYVAGSAGWRINGDGTAEFNNVAVRGGIYATYGLIGGIAIDNTGIQSTNYNALGAGWRISSAGDIHLPAGSVTAQALLVGVSANLLKDAGFAEDLTHWSHGEGGATVGATFGVNMNATYTPVGGNALFIQQTNNWGEGDPNIYQYYLQGNIPVVAGKRYNLNARVLAHRCNVLVYASFYDVAGNYTGSAINGTTISTGGGEGNLLSNYTLINLFGTAPANAATATVYVIKYATNPGQTSSYLWLTQPYFGEAFAKQTEPSPWSLGGTGTKITAKGITTPSLSALSATLGDVSAGSVRGGAYTGYGWPAAGAGGGFYLGPSGLLMGSANDGKYVQITSAGNFSAPGMSINNGVLTIDQLNVIKTANIAGNAVSTMVAGTTAIGVGTLSLSLWVPAGEYMDIAMFGLTNGGESIFEPIPLGKITLFADGVSVGSQTTSITYTDSNYTFGHSSPANVTLVTRVYGNAGRVVVLTAQGTGRQTTLVAIGTLR